MKTIPLTQGRVALVDDEDHERLSKVRWSLCNWKGREYAKHQFGGRKHRTNVKMQQMIVHAPPGMEIVYRNNNGLDNRRSNLAFASHRHAICNSKPSKSNKSGFRGVCWDKIHQAWKGTITVNYKTVNLGLFDNPVDAARAFDFAARKHHGPWARLNFPEQSQEPTCERSSFPFSSARWWALSLLRRFSSTLRSRLNKILHWRS